MCDKSKVRPALSANVAPASFVKNTRPLTAIGDARTARGVPSRDTLGRAASPVANVKPYRVDNVRMRILSDEEIPKFHAACSPDLRLIARTTLESLPRLSEVLNLHVEDILATHATIIQSKSGKSRRVPLTGELRGAWLRRAHASGFIFGQALRRRARLARNA